MGLSFLVAVMQTMWHRSGVRGVAAADALLRHAAVDQRRGRRRHRARAGVRVRDELVGVLALRRRRVRRAAGDGRAWRRSSWSRRSSACGCSAGTGCRGACTCSASGWSRSARSLSAAFIMAANSWMQHPVGYAPGPAGEPPQLNDIGARVHEPGVPLGLLPRAAGRAGHRARWCCSRSRPGICGARSRSTRSARARRWRSASSCR